MNDAHYLANIFGAELEEFNIVLHQMLQLPTHAVLMIGHNDPLNGNMAFHLVVNNELDIVSQKTFAFVRVTAVDA